MIYLGLAVLSLIFLINIYLLSLLFAVYLHVLNFKLSIVILLMEILSLRKKKIKAVVFSLILNERIKKDLLEIAHLSPKNLLSYFRKVYGDDSLTYSQLLRIQKDARLLLKNSKDNHFLSVDEVQNLLSQEGLYSFFISLKRTVNRYSSIAQQERFIESNEEVMSIFLLLASSFKPLERIFGSIKYDSTEKNNVNNFYDDLSRKFSGLFLKENLVV